MADHVEIYTAADITMAYLIKAQLENADIPAEIANENLQGVYCLGGMEPVVLVPADQAERASAVIAAFEAARRDDDADDDGEA